MSLNFIDALLDKLSTRDSGNSILMNYTGCQNLIGSNVSFNDSILLKYQEALLEATNSSTNLATKRLPLESTMFPFHHSLYSNSLVSRVSKLFFPTALSFQDYSRGIHEINFNHRFSSNKGNHPEVNIWEELMHEALNLATSISKHHSNNFDHIRDINNTAKQSIQKSDFSDPICTNTASKKIPNMVVECCIEYPQLPQSESSITPEVTVQLLSSGSTKEKSKKLSGPDMVVLTVQSSASVPKNKKLTADNGTLNQELANRKTKEIQKRSKNRRKRQKRSNRDKSNSQKSFSNISNEQKPCELGSPVACISCELEDKMQKCEKLSPAKVCNVINIMDKASSVQIILPNVSSFIITVDSADDDSDWDEENSDCEWLTDSSEFEFCGLNVSNLPCSKPNTSLLSVPPCHDEDVETLQLNMLLHRVNKEWNEATKDLDGKSRSTTKVSFVPDEKLVEVLPVEVYERKGEWEMYAIERLRFKRRIDELEKIISPCLTKEHREKFLQKYQATDL